MQPDAPPPPAPETAPAPEPQSTAIQKPAGRSAVATWFLALLAAVLAAGASGYIGEHTYTYFRLPRSVESLAAYAIDTTALDKAVSIKHSRNGALVYGTLGALLGLGLGMAGGLTRKSAGWTVAAGALGLILGTAAGSLPAFVAMPWHHYHRHDISETPSLLYPIVAHCGLWSALGAAAGLAYGLGRSGFKPLALLRGAIGGLIGAIIGAVVYDSVGFSLFPLGRTDEPFSATTTTRMLAHICAAVFIAVGAVLLTEMQATRASKPEQPAAVEV